MTENKRFTVDSDGKYFDRLNNRYLTIDNLLNELNELNTENKELKEKLEYGLCHMCGARLKYGGIELKKELSE